MSEVIVGGLIGGPLGAVIALLGTYLVIRDGRRSRVATAEEIASQKLLSLTQQVTAEPRYLHDRDRRATWLQETTAAVFAFRDPQVRDRLNQSLQLLVVAANLAPIMASEEAEMVVQHIALEDLMSCLTHRLDGSRLPKPDEAWTSATTNLGVFLAATDEAISEAEERAEEDRHNASLPPGAL
jgi:hypothetical protein